MPTIAELATTANSLAQLQKSFKRADTNANGSLSKTEFAAAAQTIPGLTAKGTTSFQKLDTDGNNELTSQELTAGINLATQVQAVLLQGQEIASGGAFNTLLGSAAATPALFNTNAGSLTTSLLGGGSASSSLTSLLTGGNTNAVASAGLFGGLSESTQALIQNLLSRYTTT